MDYESGEAVPETGTIVLRNELYVRVQLQTCDESLELSQHEVSDAAQTALIARVTQQRCKVWAIEVGQHHIQAIVQFPASLSITMLGRMIQESTGKAIAWALHVRGDPLREPSLIWSRHIAYQTLSLGDAQIMATKLRRLPHCRSA